MTWTNVYLTCFLLGLSLSLVSFLLGALNLHGFHLFHVHGHAVPHVGHGHGHACKHTAPPLSTSPPSPRFSPGSAAPGICSLATAGWWAFPRWSSPCWQAWRAAG